MRLHHRHEAGVDLIEPEGEITLFDFQQSGNPLENLLGPACWSRAVLFNLAKVTRIDSSGIGWLVVAAKHFNQHGGVLILHSLPNAITENLKTLGLLQILFLAENVEAARKMAAARVSMLAS